MSECKDCKWLWVATHDDDSPMVSKSGYIRECRNPESEKNRNLIWEPTIEGCEHHEPRTKEPQ